MALLGIYRREKKTFQSWFLLLFLQKLCWGFVQVSNKLPQPILSHPSASKLGNLARCLGSVLKQSWEERFQVGFGLKQRLLFDDGVLGGRSPKLCLDTAALLRREWVGDVLL
jgi:hypothetical protein